MRMKLKTLREALLEAGLLCEEHHTGKTPPSNPQSGDTWSDDNGGYYHWIDKEGLWRDYNTKKEIKGGGASKEDDVKGDNKSNNYDWNGPKLQNNNKSNSKVKKLLNKGNISKGEYDNFLKNGPYDIHQLSNYNNIYSGSINGDYRILWDKNGNYLDSGDHKKVYAPRNLKRLNGVINKNKNSNKK